MLEVGRCALSVALFRDSRGWLGCGALPTSASCPIIAHSAQGGSQTSPPMPSVAPCLYCTLLGMT